ncbi:MAG: hypothetical protein ACI943_002530, partial [Gammaproteobacteria bacterium]
SIQLWHGRCMVIGKFNLIPIIMKELKNRYTALKTQAMELMSAGKISAYLAKLQEVHDVRLQLIQIAAGH